MKRTHLILITALMLAGATGSTMAADNPLTDQEQNEEDRSRRRKPVEQIPPPSGECGHTHSQ